MRMHFNDGWYFTPEYCDSLPLYTAEQAKKLTSVRLPHTVKELPFNYLDEQSYQMVSGYLHPLSVPAEWEGKAVLLTFGAAAHEATVFCNGTPILTHRCGYTAFTVDLSGQLHYGKENMIAVRLDSRESLDQPPFGHVIDYLTYGGLYRAVTLEVKESSYIENVFIHGSYDGVAHLSMTARNPEGCTVCAQILHDGKLIAKITDQKYTNRFCFHIPTPPVWDPDDPKLCLLKIQLYKDGIRMDESETRFGFRTIDFRADGLYVNGIKRKLRGLNRHQSWPYMGYAVPDRAQALDADILKYELGCNCVRTSHYPQSHAFLDRCDELGLLVFTESPGWQHIGGENWKDIAVENVREMIVEYRNHPSIYIWGVRINESQDDDALYQRTNALAHRLDPTRPTGGVRNFKKSHLYEDVYTYNDFYHNGPNKGCEPKSSVTPNPKKGYLVTEYNGHMFPTKSFDWEGKRLEHALRHAQVLDTVASQEDIAGCTGWCMFDYNTHQDFGSGDRICYHGVMDMFRNPKLAAAVYASQGCNAPILQVSSSMDIGEHPAGCVGTAYAFTNADTLELYKNGEFVTRFTPGKEYGNLPHPPIPIDDTIGCLIEKHERFDPKTANALKDCLNAVAKHGLTALSPKILAKMGLVMAAKGLKYQDCVDLYGKYVANWGGEMTTWKFVAKKNSKEVASVTRGPVQSLHLNARTDTLTLTEKGTWDMATIRFTAVDGYGNVLPYCSRIVTVRLDGPLEIVGPKQIALSGGMGGTYVRTTGECGRATVTLACDGMEPVTFSYQVSKEAHA